LQYSDEVQKIFDPVVNRIVHLVEQQVFEVQQKGETVAVSKLLFLIFTLNLIDVGL